MIRSSIAHCIIEHSCSQFSTRMVVKIRNIGPKIENFTNYTVERKLSLIWSLHKNTVSILMRSALNFGTADKVLMLISREEIGVLTSLPLLRKVVEDLETARTSGESVLRLYFTKESHIHTLVNLVLFSGLPIANRRIPELDYCVRHANEFAQTMRLTSDRFSRI